MKKPSFEHFQLFRILVETRNLGVAAQKLGVPLSTASHQLKKLRDYFADPLFIHVREGMAVTEKGFSAYKKCEAVMKAYEELESEKEEDFWVIKRTVRIGCADNAPFSLFPNLLSMTSRKAPNVDYSFYPLRSDRFSLLQNNELDLVVSPIVDEDPPGCRSVRLAENRYVLIADSKHPLAERAKVRPEGLDDEDVLKYPFIDIMFDQKAKTPTLRESVFPAWKEAKAVARTTYFLPFVSALHDTEILMIVPKRTAEILTENGHVRILPTKTSSVVNYPRLFWHASTDKDPLLRWVRVIIKNTCAEI